MLLRLGRWLLTIAICLDQLAQVIVRGPKFVLLNGPKPSADQTVSDWVGQSAKAGLRAGIIAQAAIDALFGKGHCQRAIGDDDKD